MGSRARSKTRRAPSSSKRSARCNTIHVPSAEGEGVAHAQTPAQHAFTHGIAIQKHRPCPQLRRNYFCSDEARAHAQSGNTRASLHVAPHKTHGKKTKVEQIGRVLTRRPRSRPRPPPKRRQISRPFWRTKKKRKKKGETKKKGHESAYAASEPWYVRGGVGSERLAAERIHAAAQQAS